MIEFNNTFHAGLALSGYKFILYIPKDDHGIIHPLTDKAPQAFVKDIGAVQYSINDREVIDMSNNVEGFKFYIAEDIFNEQEKYNVLPQ